MRGVHTLAEIQSQPQIWRDATRIFEEQSDALSKLWQTQHFDRVIFTGCGSTHYLSQLGASLFRGAVDAPVWAFPASEIVLFPDSTLNAYANSLLITISRSGSTTETLEALRLFKSRCCGTTLAISCYNDSPLVESAELSLVINSAREESIAQTRSFSAMAIMVQALAGLFGGEDTRVLAQLPAIGERLLNDHDALARQLGEDPTIERFFFLGSQHLYPLACEAMLKMKEMSLAYSEAFHTLEFRHGPMSMVNEQTLVTGLITESSAQHEIAVLEQMKAQGARILAISEHPIDALADDEIVALEIGLPLWARPIAYLPVLQLLAYYRAMANKQNPDRPANLDAVVVVDNLV